MTRAVVIGAAGGIGAACVRAFEAADREVLAADLAGPEVLDVTDADAVREFASRAGPVDSVVYAAGVVATMPIADTDFAVWRRIMAVNLDGAAHVAAAFARGMEGGAMVFVSSAAGVRGESNASAYSASKAGLIGLVQAVAAELAPRGIRVNAVAPGNVDTPMLRKVAEDIAMTEGRDVSEVWDGFARMGAAQRILAPDEVAEVCIALCSPGFAGVTGTVLPVDGGYLL